MFSVTDPAALFFLLLGGHAISDFGLQSEWVATHKNRHIRDDFSEEQKKRLQIIWPHLMTSHALTHGFFVYIITGKLALGVAETVIHWITDFGKCERWYGFHADQAIHIVCKIIWVALISFSIV